MPTHSSTRHRTILSTVWIGCVLAVGFFALGAPGHAEESSTGSAGFRTLADFLAVAEHSDVLYEFKVEAGDLIPSAVDELWPQYQGDGIRSFGVTVSDTGNQLEMRECSEAAEEALGQAESAFQQKDLVAAAASYQKALEADPDCYEARLYFGDTHLHSRRFAEALAAYEAAIELNPLDYRGHFFRGSALLYLGRQAEAQEAFVDALTMKPRHQYILQAVESRPGLGLRAVDSSLEIPIRLELVDGEVHLTVPAGQPVWISFGLCKAVQIGEGEVELGSFSSEKESECFASLLAGYSVARDQGETEPDPKLDWLLDVAQSGYLNEWTIYEFGSRLSPYVTVLLPEDHRAEIRRFIREHVLIPR